VKFARAFARFWWDFIVGDEWRIAVLVCVATALGAFAASEGWLGGQAIALGVAAGLLLTVSAVIIATGRRLSAPRSR
jgi:hypothetical protein